MRDTAGLAIALLAFTLAACAPGGRGTDASRAEQCRDRFEAYDQALLFQPSATLGVLQPIPRQRGVLNSRTAAESALLQFGCTTTPREMPELEGRDLSAFARPVPETAAPRRYLHVAAVTSNTSEARLRTAFRDLGYPVRVKGAEKLGRRVFIGPLGSTPEQQTALALARELGFASAYFLTRVP